MKLLVVEDEKVLQSALKKGFTKLGYAVDTADDGEEALEYWFSSYYDVVILDLNLPKKDGIDVLRAIREENADARVLILSARNEVEDRIIGLDLGANDYLGKPFHFKELEARVHALARREFRSRSSAVVCEEGLVIDTARKAVFVKEEEIQLTKKEYAILEYLALHKGRVISPEELIEHIWDSEADAFSNAFKVHISGLRKKLPADTIKNNRGQGYYVE